jgi:hypothetical protein
LCCIPRSHCILPYLLLVACTLLSTVHGRAATNVVAKVLDQHGQGTCGCSDCVVNGPQAACWLCCGLFASCLAPPACHVLTACIAHELVTYIPGQANCGFRFRQGVVVHPCVTQRCTSCRAGGYGIILVGVAWGCF